MICVTVKGIDLKFNTAAGLFSPDRIDKGTLAMLSVAEFSAEDKILDLGCGYGVVGIAAARAVGSQNVVMSDVNEKAVKLSRENAVLNEVGDVKIVLSDGFNAVSDKDFTLILSNPPYHADFSVPKHFIEKGFNRLKQGGRMFMVTKRREWYKNKFIGIFGGVRVHEIDGYYVFCGEKRGLNYAKGRRS